MPAEDDQLYVRVDGYKVLLQDLEAIRQIIDNIQEASEVLEQVRIVKEKSIDTIYENLDRLNDKLEDVEVEMPEVEPGQSVSMEVEQHEQVDHIDDSVNELHSELENLQDELSDLGD
ncbi:MAG: chromosome segregation ATPase [Candidatus Nanohaloarchaea archaeon]|jgi:chromosome segregation ATPase